MSIYTGNHKTTLYKGDFLPAQLFKGSKKILGYTEKTFSGQNLTINRTYSDKPKKIIINGNFIPSKNLFDIGWITKYALVASAEIVNNKLILGQYANSTSITPELFLAITGLKEGDEIYTFHTTNLISGSLNSFSGRLLFASLSSEVPQCILTLGGEKRKTVIPQNFNSNNYKSLMIYGAISSENSGSLEISDFMLTKDASAIYEPYITPELQTLTWNGENIEIPYVLHSNHSISCDLNVVTLDTEIQTDITKTEIGQKLLSLKTLPSSNNLSLSEGNLEITVKVAD